MENLKYTFKNKGLSEYNDDVFDHSPFELRKKEYTFLIHPKSETKFWRFGIVLSKKENFDFSPNSGRYDNKDLKFIQINVGDYKSKQWTNSNKLELQTYYFKEYKTPIYTLPSYKEFSDVEFKISYDSEGRALHVSFINGEYTFPGHSFSLNEYQYFKLFAWADETPFEIGCEIIITNKALFNFPKLALSENEIKYLEIIYQNFLSNTQIESAYSIVEIWNDFPSDFHPSKINQLLIQGDRNITLWGIWNIHPESNIFEKFDTVIFAIRNILGEGTQLKEISSTQIRSKYPNISNLEIWQIFQLMSHFRNFIRGLGKKDDLTSTISLHDEAVYQQYRDYRGLQTFLTDFLTKQGIPVSPAIPIIQHNEPSVRGNIIFSKTRLLRRHRSDFEPVIGVTELSNDLANIIYDLPEERGQMMGIFGKWGRGKTFLLTELWKVIESQKDVNYIKVEYHAWKYQETPASWAYLYELLSNEYLGENKWGNIKNYYWRLLKLNFKRVGWIPTIKLSLAVLITITGIILSQYLKGWLYSVGLSSLLLIGFATYLQQLKKEFSTKATDLIKKYTIRHSFKASMGIQADIQEELIKLLKVWIPDIKEKARKEKKKKTKIFLVVEDMDRCTEDRIIQNIDALRVMLEDDEISKRLIIVTAIDERILKSAVRTKYESLVRDEKKEEKPDPEKENIPAIERVNINELVSEYLDKLFISAIKLGELTTNQKEEYLKELFKKEIEESKPVGLLYNKANGDNKDITESNSTIKSNSTTQTQAYDLAIRNGDFELKDGDIALEDSSGQVISIQEIENIGKEKDLHLDKWEKLTRFEIKFLTQTIRSWPGVTPRRISIFYYRYLLCKNILINKYFSFKKENRWQDEKNIEALLLILRYYSDLYDPEKILIEKNRIADLPNSNGPISIEPSSLNFSILKNDYLYLLEVLELVIAY